MSIVQRINQLIENEGITATKLEKMIGASKGVLSRAITKDSDIQTKWLTPIVENFQHYNTDWLLTGKGDMLNTSATVKEPNTDYPKANQEKIITEKLDTIIKQNEEILGKIKNS